MITRYNILKPQSTIQISQICKEPNPGCAVDPSRSLSQRRFLTRVVCILSGMSILLVGCSGISPLCVQCMSVCFLVGSQLVSWCWSILTPGLFHFSPILYGQVEAPLVLLLIYICHSKKRSVSLLIYNRLDQCTVQVRL